MLSSHANLLRLACFIRCIYNNFCCLLGVWPLWNVPLDLGRGPIFGAAFFFSYLSRPLSFERVCTSENSRPLTTGPFVVSFHFSHGTVTRLSLSLNLVY